MRFLVDGDLPTGAIELLLSHGHDVTHIVDIDLGGAPDTVLALHSIAHQMCLLTGDFDFADIRNYPPEDHFGIVVLTVPVNARRGYIMGLIESFLRQPDLVNQVRGRLAVVEFGRIRFRPPLE